MDKYVYLFELDSRRNSDNEVTYAQKVILEEIFVNGNKVVLTANQMIDSKAIIELISNEELQSYFLTLFKLHVLSIYHHGKNQSISQYFQEKLTCNLNDDENSFIFSGLPIEHNDYELQEAILHALVNCDLKSIEEHISKVRKSNIINKEVRLKELTQLLQFVKAILSISLLEYGINIKGEERKSMDEFICDILSVEATEYAKTKQFENIFIQAQAQIKELTMSYFVQDKNINLRSNWIFAIKESNFSTEVKQLMELIIDLCYNYTLEANIPILSKHYDEDTNKPSFILEFFNRLNFEMHKYDRLEKTNRKFKDKVNMWKSASNLCVLHQKQKTLDIQTKLYEENHKEECKIWKTKILKRILKNIILAFLSIFIFLLISWIIDTVVSDLLIASGVTLRNEFLYYVISFVLATLIYFPFELIFKIIDFTNALVEIKMNCKDRYHLMLCEKKYSYLFIY